MITENQITRNKNNILNILNSVEREGIIDLCDFLVNSDFFISPASTKYHSNYPGGLAEHSYSVYKSFLYRVKENNLKVPDDSITLSSICHDLCKIGVYSVNSLKDGKRSTSKPYKFEDSFSLGHGEKSLYLLNQYVKTTQQEAMIIRWHMGIDDPGYRDYSEEVEKRFPEAVFFQHVDKECSLLKKI